jgi:endoglucanase
VKITIITVKDLLEKLIDAYGVSGSEEEVREIIQKEIRKYVDEVHIDKLGNLIARKRGSFPRVMLAAHMDEVGLVAKNISPDGKVYFSLIGGIEPLTLLGQRVIVKNKNKRIVGVVSSERMEEGRSIREPPQLEDLFVDFELNAKELEKAGIGIGAFIVFEQTTEYLDGGRTICGKALDDRIGCYILIELAKLLKKTKNDIYFVFTVQEEIGLYGAKASSYKIEPDWAIAVDATYISEKNSAKAAGKGPCITIKDVSMIGNKCINKWLLNTAKKKKIPVQLDVSDFGTTDALTISLSRGGVPCTTVGIAIKNIHSSVGVASLKDIKNAIVLLHELLKNPPKVCAV